MEIFIILIQVFFISLTGVMAPGPLTVITVGKGLYNPHAGVLISIGHAIVEIPIIVFIFLTFKFLVIPEIVKSIIFFIGAFFLLFSAVSLLKQAKQNIGDYKNLNYSSIFSGMLLSFGNPYFLIWWLTTGAMLILKVVKFKLGGFILFVITHLFCDFSWLYFLSIFSFNSKKILGVKFQKVLIYLCVFGLLFFGVKFIFDGFYSLKN